jgi:hypothetical protein
MEKWMCLGSMGISGILLVVFALDLIMKIPFGGLSSTVDIIGIIAAALISYLGWESFREQR